MITTDQADQPRRRRRRGGSAFLIGLGAIVVAGFTLVSLTSPDPAASEATTLSTSTTSTTLASVEPPLDLENFSVDQLARGEPFAWESTLSVLEGYPLALLRHDGDLYLFSTEVPNFASFETGGLRGWRSRDGLAWEPLGEVIDGSHMIAVVESTGQGLVALEHRPGHSTFTIWQSDNGSEWDADEIAVDHGIEPATIYPSGAGGTGSLMVVAAEVQVDTLAPLREKLGGTADQRWGAEVVGDEVQFTLYGPLGWRLGVVSGAELDLTDEETESIISAYSGEAESAADLWVRADDSDWRATLIPEADWIDRITTGPDGDVVAHGWGPAGAMSWTSMDGLSWEASPHPVRHYLNDRWGDRLVAPHPNEGLSVLVSADGSQWDDIGPSESFPGLIQWWTSALAAGPGGIATTIEGSDEGAPFPDTTLSPRTASITNQDGTLTIDARSGEYTLELADQTFTWPATTLQNVEVDLDTGSIRYLDPETGDPLTSFPLEDLIAAQSELLTIGSGDGTRYGVFAFTSDGTEWTIQSVDHMGSGDIVTHLAVTDTHVVAGAMDLGAFYNPSSPPGFNVWTAAIP